MKRAMFLWLALTKIFSHFPGPKNLTIIYTIFNNIMQNTENEDNKKHKSKTNLLNKWFACTQAGNQSPIFPHLQIICRFSGFFLLIKRHSQQKYILHCIHCIQLQPPFFSIGILHLGHCFVF